ncbi:MAG: hypothetical protein IPK83_05920 [Planctomycetes bacterium]|nr:hypothetical protein [Planctomycetota bacterium]
MSTLLFILCIAMRVEPLPAVPSELHQGFRQRCDFRSAKFVYKHTEVRPGRAHRIKNMEQLSVGNDIMQADKGDDDGIRLKDPVSGSPLLGLDGACNSKFYVIRHDPKETWSRTDGLGYANLSENKLSTVFQDVRLVGIAPWSSQNTTLNEQIHTLDTFPFKKWEKSIENDVIVFTGWFDDGENNERAYEWHLDPARDMIILKVVSLSKRHGTIRRSVLFDNQYKKVDGIWWPESVMMKYGRGLSRRIDYKEVSFNDKSHPKKITADAMGLPVGQTVRLSGEGMRVMRYAGQGLTMSEEEFKSRESTLDLGALERYRLDQRTLGVGDYPTWWNEAGADFGLSARRHDPDAWEAYVRRWKLRHTHDTPHPLGQNQVTAADALLKQCRDRAQNLLKKAEKTKQDQAVTDKKLSGIFDELKRRLDGILASKQTAAEVKADVASE